MDINAINEKEKVRKLKERMESLVKTKLEDAGLKVRFQEADIWEYRPGEGVLKFVPSDLYSMTDRGVIAEVVHNIGHALYSQTLDFEKLELPEPTEQFFQLANQVEDIRIEEQMMQMYPGTHTSFLYKFKKNDSQISGDVEQKLPPHTQFIYMLAKNFWGDLKTGEVPENVQKALNDASDVLFDAYNVEKTQDMLEIVQSRLWPIFQRLIPPPPPPNGGGGKGDGKNQQKSQQGQGEGGGQGQGQSGGGQQQQGQENEKSDAQHEQLERMAQEALDVESIQEAMKQMSKGQKPEADSKPNFGQDVDAQMDAEEAAKAQEGQGIDGDDPVFGGWGNTKSPPKDIDQDTLSYEAMYHEIMPILPFFKKKLNSIMKDNRYSRHGGSFRTGKLNNKKLWRFHANSDKLFSRKMLRRHRDYKVTIMVDESGSMHGEKMRQAAKAACLFSEVLNAVGIDFEVRGFNSNEYMYKPFNEKFSWKHRREMEAISRQRHTSGAGGNNDGFNIWLAADSLRKASTRETERILIMISDGQPAEDYDTVPRKYHKALPTNKRNYKDFELRNEIAYASKDCVMIGVGIRAPYVREYYPQPVLCDDVKELPPLVLQALKKNIRRG